MIKAFIFDLDGVLTDTAEYHYLAWKELADELALSFDRKVNERLKGVSRIRSFEIILEHNGAQSRYTAEEKAQYADRKNLRYCELIRNITPSDLLPGIASFIAAAKADGLLLAVASASRNAASVLQSLNIIEEFDYVANAAEVKNPKPHPEVFLACAGALGCAPEECVGFEDAQAGIEAIKAAHMHAVGIRVDVTTIPPDVHYASTAELDVPTILKTFDPNRASKS